MFACVWLVLQCFVYTGVQCTNDAVCLYPASRARRPHSSVTFCSDCCRGIRRTGWTLVSVVVGSIICVLSSSFPPNLHFADTFFSHPFLEPSSTIKKCKHRKCPKNNVLLFPHHPADYWFTPLSMSSPCPEHLQCSNGQFVWQFSMYSLQLAPCESLFSWKTLLILT